MPRKKKPKKGSIFERLLEAIAASKNMQLEHTHQTFLDEWLWTFENDDFGEMDVSEINLFKYILEKYDL